MSSDRALAAALLLFLPAAGWAAQPPEAAVFSVVELTFRGPAQTPRDAPSRDVEFWVRFQHEGSDTQHTVQGFWDGDGQGGSSGDVFVVRFCPTKPGRWILAEVHSNDSRLKGQRQGAAVLAAASKHPGFWVVDPQSPGSRWYARSDGSHPYIVGNTHYSFLSGYEAGDQPSGNDIAQDVAANARYFKKLRLGLSGDRYPHPTEKPFLDDDGQPTDAGDYSHRPNPRWFRQRVDPAVQTALQHDLIADLILAGPDQETSRSTLRAAGNQGDATPFLRYIAARYGSYPNVWICLCNEYDIKVPMYSEQQIAEFGQIVRPLLPYPTPLSVHASPRKLWAAEFDELEPWSDHQIIQEKLRNLAAAADVIEKVWRNPGGRPRNKPTVNDELSYQGAGDRHSEQDTIESHLGAFLGGGYGTTGEKSGNKLGQYFRGRFDPREHTAADHLDWLRETIDANVSFWQMAPDLSIFANLDPDFRGLAWPNQEYVLGSNRARQAVVARLPAGTWRVARHDVVRKQTRQLADSATGDFTFDTPDSRAVLFHFQRTD